MTKTLLIVGKDYPLSLKYITAAQSNNRVVFSSSEAEFQSSDKKQSAVVVAESPAAIPWNRASPVSARSMIIKAETESSKLDEVLLVFDSAMFASKYKQMSPAVLQNSIDDMTLGFSYVVSEVLERYSLKKTGRLIFIIRYAPSSSDKLYGIMHKSVYDEPVSIPVASSQQYFISMAENTAAVYSGTNGISVVLVRSENESDESIADWLFPYIDAIPASYIASGKNAVSWIKPGSKPPSSFQFFHR